MAQQFPELPRYGEYIRAIRESATSAREWANITVSEDAIKRLLLSPAFTATFPRLRKSHGYAFPLAFPSPLAELNLVATLSLLSFGSGYRVPLHAATGRGTFGNIRALVLTMYISSAGGDEGNHLSARGMQALRAQTVAELMGVQEKVHQERAHETIPGLVVGELGGDIWELVKLVTGVMNETGEALLQGGYPDLGAFVFEALKEGQKARDREKACDVVLERLVRGIPAFWDMALVNGRPVYCFQKALLTLHAIYMRFATDSGSASSPSTFPIPPGADSLPIFVDNVIPSLLVHLGVLDLSTSEPSLGLSQLFPGAGASDSPDAPLAAPPPPKDGKTRAPRVLRQEGPLLTPEQAYVLRAAAIDACEQIVRAARALDVNGRDELTWVREMTPPEVDAWLRAAAKDRADYRKLPRFVLRGTPYF